MRICYIHQFFCTNEGSAGTRSYDVSRHLAAMGHQVTMICGVEDKSGLTMGPWYKPIRRVRMAGFDVLICNVRYMQKQGMKARMWAFFKFAVLATFAACFLCRRQDVVFATSQPLTVCVPGFLAARLHRAPFCFEVRDIWPETDIISGNLREDSLFVRLLLAMERLCYLKAQRIFLVSPGFQTRLIERGYDGRKMRTVLLGADGDLFENLEPDVDFRTTHDLEGKTVAIYAGVFGRANGLDYIIDAAGLLNDRQDIALVLLGGGMERDRLVARADQMGLSNLRFLDYVPKVQLPGILAACDIALLILADVGERPVTPNKLFDYLFAGLPILVNFEGPTATMLHAEGTGKYVDATRPEELAQGILHWADHSDETVRTGEHARKTAYEKYERRGIAAQMADAFSEACGAGLHGRES